MAIDISKILLLLDPVMTLSVVSLLTITLLILYTMSKLQTISSLRVKINHLDKIIKDLDQQAKLIIKGDMELKLYQQEIEDKLNKLTLIKNLIISSIHILDKEKLFPQINEKILNELGFRKGAILDFPDLETKVTIDFGEGEIAAIKNAFKHKRELLKEIQLLSPEAALYKQLLYELQTSKIIAAPIKARDRIYAIFIASDPTVATDIKKSDEETVLIICMYLSQCLDNINLFESLHHNRDDLEKKIKERTNELVRSLRAIEEISKAKSGFISSVSHELRTPLTSVKGFSSLLVDEKFGKLPEEAKNRLMKIDENVNKIMAIVNTLLDISRIESGKMEIKIAPFEIAKIIKDVIDFLAPQIQAKEIDLKLDIPEKLNVYMDKNLIERVLINLVDNAIKFTPRGGKIEVSCKKENNLATICVSDAGCGIKKDDLKKLFEEFFRAEVPAGSEAKGSGLGLSLVKRIIDTHKERIWVESEVGKGTSFYFTLRTTENV